MRLSALRISNYTGDWNAGYHPTLHDVIRANLNVIPNKWHIYDLSNNNHTDLDGGSTIGETIHT